MARGLALDRYLARIAFAGQPAVDLATLQALQAAHTAAIPFEGLDPFLGREVRLDLDSLQGKLIDGCRGGYCFEQNSLFKAALEAIGFCVTGLGGRVRWNAPPDSPLGPRLHMLLRVDLPEGAFIADVGFGGCVMDAPLRLAAGVEQRTPMGSFVLRERDELYWLSAKQPEGWRPMYVFDQVPQLAADYELGSYYTSTSPRVPFTNSLIMERVGAGARHKLLNRRLRVEARDGKLVAEREIADPHDLAVVLESMFGVVPPIPSSELFARLPG